MCTIFATPWIVARQAPLSMGLSRQEYWSGLPFPSPGHFPNPGTKPGSRALQADALSSDLLQGIFLTQGSNLSLLHCRQILYCLSCQGSLYAYIHVCIYI